MWDTQKRKGKIAYIMEERINLANKFQQNMRILATAISLTLKGSCYSLSRQEFHYQAVDTRLISPRYSSLLYVMFPPLLITVMHCHLCSIVSSQISLGNCTVISCPQEMVIFL